MCGAIRPLPPWETTQKGPTNIRIWPRSARVDDMRHSAAKDRTFKIVRPNQGTASGRR